MSETKLTERQQKMMNIIKTQRQNRQTNVGDFVDESMYIPY